MIMTLFVISQCNTQSKTLQQNTMKTFFSKLLNINIILEIIYVLCLNLTGICNCKANITVSHNNHLIK